MARSRFTFSTSLAATALWSITIFMTLKQLGKRMSSLKVGTLKQLAPTLNQLKNKALHFHGHTMLTLHAFVTFINGLQGLPYMHDVAGTPVPQHKPRLRRLEKTHAVSIHSNYPTESRRRKKKKKKKKVQLI